MLTRLSKNSFIRIYDNGKLGYINNQLTKHDRTYTESGADFLRQIDRLPKNEKDIVDEICKLYDAPYDVIARDFEDFITDLESHKFVVRGLTIEELNASDTNFTYAIDNPKTLAEDFTQNTKEIVDKNTQDYLLQHDRKYPRLASLQFELTSRCNERCIHCYIPNSKKNAGFDLSFDKFRYIIDQYVDMGGLHVTLSGGEALMNKHIKDMLRYCREKDLQISLLTNLISLTDDLLHVLKEVNLSLLQVSFYSMDAEIHDKITTVKGSWEKTKNAIEKLYAADVPVQISCPIMKANKGGYKRIMKYAQSLKMKSMTDYIMMAQADLNVNNLANRISLKETEEVIRDIIEYDLDYKNETLNKEPITNTPIEEQMSMPLCGAGINDLCVTVNGDVYPCAGWQAFVVGNVFKTSLKDIWENSEQLKMIRRVTWKNFPKCLECDVRDYCNMCLVRNYNENNGDMFKTADHFCKVAKLNKQLAEEYKEKGLL
jgi:radical SAM protein with 4Fe4S-binding SPASM domain